MNFVYLTTNLINGKQYIGSHEGDINDRYLGSGKPYFLNAVKKYGKENFDRIILEECDPSLNLILETKYIKEYNTLVPNGYNISPTGGVKYKGKHSKESKKKMSDSHKNKKFSEEHRKKLSDSKKGKPSVVKGLKWSEESRKKLSDSKKGSILSEEHKKNISISTKGRTSPIWSEESRKKLSDSKKGKPSVVKGLKWSEESRKKLSDSKKGKPSNNKGNKYKLSDEQLEKRNNIKKIKCEYCGKEFKPNMFYRWHGKNCKKYIN